MKVRLFMLLPALVTTATVHAGGHFDVDDAGTLDPGQCQYEVWAGRTGVEPLRVFHLGPACRVGPVELGLNLDRYAGPDGRLVALGPQIKWTFLGAAADDRLGAAVSAGATWDLTRGGRPGREVVVPVSWRALDSLWLHANLGADWATGGGARYGRGGLAGEWAMTSLVSVIVERNRAFDLWTTRAGLRLNLTPLISIDLSASRTGPQGTRGFMVCLNHEFSR